MDGRGHALVDAVEEARRIVGLDLARGDDDHRRRPRTSAGEASQIPEEIAGVRSGQRQIDDEAVRLRRQRRGDRLPGVGGEEHPVTDPIEETRHGEPQVAVSLAEQDQGSLISRRSTVHWFQ